MAKSTKSRASKDKGPPSPGDYGAFANWLTKQPREWSVAIATRGALRVLPLALVGKSPDVIVLPVFRAIAIARFAAKYPNRTTDAFAAEAAAFAISARATRFASASAARAAAGVAAAARASAEAASAVSASAVAASAADAVDAAASAASAVGLAKTVVTACKNDAQRLHDKVLTAEQLTRGPLWQSLPPPHIVGAWLRLAEELHVDGNHWLVWTDWYDAVVAGVAADAEEAAFTDMLGTLPWEGGAEAVNMKIAQRLKALREGAGSEPVSPKLGSEEQKATTIARLAEVASPQPSITDKGLLDAGPNQPFDIPEVDDDLSTLPLRQRNLIKGILSDLPANAPKHLKDFLRSYDEELKVRGAQPILGLLKDDADIVAAAVTAPRAEDEWLEPGMRKAFDRFTENHTVFVEHFPLDAERETVYAQTSLHEEDATGKKLVEPFEIVAKATQEAHRAGATTDDFMTIIDKMTEFARVLSTQPLAPPPRGQSSSPSAEIKISRDDYIQPVSTKKRALLGALGFFERTYNLLGSTVTIAAAGYVGIVEALKPAIEILSRFLR